MINGDRVHRPMNHYCGCHRYYRCCYYGFRRHCNCPSYDFRPMSRYCCVNRCSCCPTNCCFESMKTSRRYKLMMNGLMSRCCMLTMMSCHCNCCPMNCVSTTSG